MLKREGLNSDEEELDFSRVSYQTLLFHKGDVFHTQEFTNGELVLTQKGIVFLEFKGIFNKTRSRHHSYDYDIIQAVRSESGAKFLLVDVNEEKNSFTLKYSCNKNDSARIQRIIAKRLFLRTTTEQLHNELVRFLKSVSEANLYDIAKTESINKILTRLFNTSSLEEKIGAKAVIDGTRLLIAEGKLDGVISNSGKYISKLSLSRKSIQYRVSIDFSGIVSRLKGKGIVLESLECPSCKGKLDYPDAGSFVLCKFCGATVSAVDVFEKFKGLLDT